MLGILKKIIPKLPQIFLSTQKTLKPLPQKIPGYAPGFVPPISSLTTLNSSNSRNLTRFKVNPNFFYMKYIIVKFVSLLLFKLIIHIQTSLNNFIIISLILTNKILYLDKHSFIALSKILLNLLVAFMICQLQVEVISLKKNLSKNK